MLEVRDLECVRGDLRLFTGLSFTLQAGELLHLKGSNGSGKTSLMRTICGLMMPVAGEILWRGENTRSHREEFNQELTYLGHLNGIKGEFSAIENLNLCNDLSSGEREDGDVLAALAKMGLARRAELPTKVLSQGQKRRVALSRLLISSCKLWVLDEPFTALDVAAVALLKQLIVDHLNSGGIVILTTHQEVDIDASAIKEVNLDS